MAHSPLYVQIMNSKAWKDTRGRYLSEHPLCEDCKAKGIYTPAQCVHHLVEVESAQTDKDSWELATNPGNLRALCFQCHSIIHTQQRSHTKEAHKQRQAERLARWKERYNSKR